MKRPDLPLYYYHDHFVEMLSFVRTTYGSILTDEHDAFVLKFQSLSKNAKFWAYVIIDPIRDDNGGLIGFAKVTRDLTECRQAEESLRKTQEQFRILVQGVTDYAIYLLSPEGEVTSLNAGAQKIKGDAPEEIIGKHFSQF